MSKSSDDVSVTLFADQEVTQNSLGADAGSHKPLMLLMQKNLSKTTWCKNQKILNDGFNFATLPMPGQQLNQRSVCFMGTGRMDIVTCAQVLKYLTHRWHN